MYSVWQKNKTSISPSTIHLTSYIGISQYKLTCIIRNIMLQMIMKPPYDYNRNSKEQLNVKQSRKLWRLGGLEAFPTIVSIWVQSDCQLPREGVLYKIQIRSNNNWVNFIDDNRKTLAISFHHDSGLIYSQGQFLGARSYFLNKPLIYLATKFKKISQLQMIIPQLRFDIKIWSSTQNFTKYF